jgi:hypothetical protein
VVEAHDRLQPPERTETGRKRGPSPILRKESCVCRTAAPLIPPPVHGARMDRSMDPRVRGDKGRQAELVSRILNSNTLKDPNRATLYASIYHEPYKG